VNGRQPHLLVDTTGLGVKARVHPAAVPEGAGGQRLLEASTDREHRVPVCTTWGDAAYHGSFKDWVEQGLGWTVEVVRKPRRWCWVGPGQHSPEVPSALQVLPRRWVVARTLGWIGRWRRTSKDYEYLPTTSQCVIYAIMTRIMLRRLATSEG
jgi:putative transposase